jgi:hypothetical protein
MPFTTKVLSPADSARAREWIRAIKLGWKAVKGDSDLEKSVPPHRTPIIIVSQKRSNVTGETTAQHTMRW